VPVDVTDGDMDWVGVCDGVPVGEHTFLIAVKRTPRKGSDIAHVLPPSPLAQLPDTLAMPFAGTLSTFGETVLCQLTASDEDNTSAYRIPRKLDVSRMRAPSAKSTYVGTSGIKTAESCVAENAVMGCPVTACNRVKRESIKKNT
jgi:hypothetical protein